MDNKSKCNMLRKDHLYFRKIWDMLISTNYENVVEREARDNRQVVWEQSEKRGPSQEIPVYNEDSLNSIIVSFQLLYQGTLALTDRSDEENMALLS